MADNRGRGPVAVADMKARVAAGWSVSELWDRMAAAEAGEGYNYDYAEKLPDGASVEAAYAES